MDWPRFGTKPFLGPIVLQYVALGVNEVTRAGQIDYTGRTIHINGTRSKTTRVNVGPISSRRRKCRLDIGLKSTLVVLY